ncbi:DUF2280 domain-containing protein [Salinarimonas soli]|uniref:DUF2280 domain-containing protein n=1 Tax=Salinarimonas soli TaxID=1638099 RepID=A0A5B2VFP4_9HYPH|nr:DUF2280 domain-containing protein [Salinarimonas soli]KAA2237685.1 DUF2280 domain-containing protein [Salinarimonas soli]
MATLTDEVKAFIVQGLACFDQPSVVVEAVKAEFGQVVTRQQVEGYDPGKRAGAKLSEKWRAIFAETRKAFLEDTAAIPVANKAVRLRILQRLVERAEARGNAPLVAELLEQIAKECGDAFTNRRELTGKGGGPIEAQVRPDLKGLDQDERDALRAILERRAGGPARGT